jgi:pimeloyl-ACP methyl ester carboxylesterase
MSERAHLKKVKVPSKKIPAPASYTGKFIEADNLKLHYLDYGTEGCTPMLCVHGGAAHAHWFDFVAPGFTTGYHVRALDCRGHGDSAWADPPAYSYSDYATELAEVVEKLDLRDFVLVGHSMGGLVSLLYAAKYPGRVSRLVIVDSRMHMSKESIARLRDMGTRPSRNYATNEELIARYRLEPAGTMNAAPEVVRHVARYSGRQFPDGSWRHKFDRSLYAIFERLDAMPCWNDIKIPALLIKGEHSDRIDAEGLAQIRARSPQVALAEVPNSDHHIMLDNPAGFVEAVTAFLDRSR